MTRYTFHVGFTTVDSRAITEDQLASAREILATTYKGYTEYATRGYWEGIFEPGLTWEVLSHRTTTTARRVARELAVALQQSAVMVTTTPTAMDMVTPTD